MHSEGADGGPGAGAGPGPGIAGWMSDQEQAEEGELLQGEPGPASAAGRGRGRGGRGGRNSSGSSSNGAEASGSGRGSSLPRAGSAGRLQEGRGRGSSPSAGGRAGAGGGGGPTAAQRMPSIPLGASAPIVPGRGAALRGLIGGHDPGLSGGQRVGQGQGGLGDEVVRAHQDAVTCVVPTPDGLHWLTAGTDSRLRLWVSSVRVPACARTCGSPQHLSMHGRVSCLPDPLLGSCSCGATHMFHTLGVRPPFACAGRADVAQPPGVLPRHPQPCHEGPAAGGV